MRSNQSFYRQFAGYGKGLGHHKVGQWWTEVNYQQNSYLPVIGVYSTMHLMHPNYWQITIMYVCAMYMHVSTADSADICIDH